MARLPRKTPEVNGGSWGTPPTFNHSQWLADIGSTGLRAFSGYVREDFVPNLTGRQGATIYREMLDSSPVVGAVIFAIQGIMRKVEWRVQPADDSPEAEKAAEFADSLRFDMHHSWEDFISEALSMLGYGYSVHEIVYKRRNGPKPFGSKVASSKYDDGMIGWRKLPTRSQDTLLKWFFDENGEVLGFTQQPWVGPLCDIPMEKCLLFRPSAHKNNPEGRAILRNAYRPYYFVKRLEEGEAIMIERMAGNVVVRVPTALLDQAAAGNAQAIATLSAYKKMATNARTDEQMGLLLPSDTFQGATGPSAVRMFDYEYITPQSGAKALEPNTPIVRHKLDILSSVLCDFIQMGHTNRGAQNLADTKVDLFMTSVEGWLNAISAVLNQQGLSRIWTLNGMDPKLKPEIIPDMAQQVDLDMLGSFILSLSQSGAQLFPDEDLEAYIRDVAGFPDAKDGESWRSMQEEDQNDAPATDPKKATADAIAREAVKAMVRKRRQAKRV